MRRAVPALCTLLALCGLDPASAAPTGAAAIPDRVARPDRIARGWTPNLGQMAGATGTADPGLLFATDTPGGRVFVTREGLRHVFMRSRPREEARDARAPRAVLRRDPRLVDWARLELVLEGAEVRPERARAEEPIAGHGVTHYYLAHCPQGVRDVPGYARVVFPEVYPGIDWVVRTESDRSVHHDFVVAPGADPSQLRLRYEGAESMRVSDDGRTLLLRTALGEVREGALACWQGSPAQPVGARFRLEGGSVRVDLDAYDRTQPLVIDPPLTWFTLYGGDSFDGPDQCVTDPLTGDLYVVGYTASTNMPVNPSPPAFFQGTIDGSTDAFIWKFDAAGALLWATYVGGTDWDVFADCDIAPNGDLVVVGQSPSSDFPVVNLGGAWNQATLGGASDGVVLRFTPAGALVWSTFHGGVDNDVYQGVVVDAGGRIHAAGTSASADMPLVDPGGGAYFQPVLNGGTPGYDALISQFDANGSLTWSSFVGGGPDWDYGNGITESAGNIYLTGEAGSPNFPTVNPGGAYYQASNAGAQDGYVCRFTLAGAMTWSTYFGGSGYDALDEPVVDGAGRLFVNGFTDSNDLPLANPGGTTHFQPALGGVGDFVITRFGAANQLEWSTYYGGSGNEGFAGYTGKTLDLDAQGRLYMTGMTASADFPLQNAAGRFNQALAGGGNDAMILHFANDGTRLWATFLGRPATDFGRSVHVAANGCLYSVGETQDDAGPLGVDPLGGAWYQPLNQSLGQDEGYIARFCPAPYRCCLDFNCIGVFSAAECAQLGGNFAAQTCDANPCPTSCGVCGTKFHDLDGDGVRDSGEPPLAGWTIRLLDPSNTVVATTVTDANGDYCFTGLPCGAYTVAEVQQPGWIATAPAGGSHFVGPPIGTTLQGVDFGNRACAGAAPCVGAPPNTAARWTFDVAAGTSTALDIAHPEPPYNRAQVVLGGGAAGGSGQLCMFAPGDHARVPASDQLELDFGTGSFALAVRLVAEPAAGTRMLVDQRVPVGGLPGAVRGFALYLDGMQAFLEVGAGGAPQVFPGPVLVAGTPTQVAVSLDRVHGTGLWYLDGETMPAFTFTPPAGSVTTGADLLIGQSADGLAPSAPVFACLDELVVFDDAVNEPAARKAFGPPPAAWCPDYALLPSTTAICKDRDSVQVCFRIGNRTGTPQTYQWSLAGLPAGAGCSVAGPVQFSPAAGSVTVPAGGLSAPVCVLVQRPAGLVAPDSTACFQLTWANAATGECRSLPATLRADTSCWCAGAGASPVATVAARVPTGATIALPVEHPCDPRQAPYRVTAVWTDTTHADPLALSLNGYAPGSPLTGVLTGGPGAPGTLEVRCSYPRGFDPVAHYALVLEMDTDGDGLLEPVHTTLVSPSYAEASTVDVPAPPSPAAAIRLSARPNPFTGRTALGFVLARPGPVELTVYDLSGARIRTLARGPLAAGAHAFEWDGRTEQGQRVPAGIYFVRLAHSGQRAEAKLVKVQ